MTAIKRAALYPPFIFICGIYAIDVYLTARLEEIVCWFARQLEA